MFGGDFVAAQGDAGIYVDSSRSLDFSSSDMKETIKGQKKAAKTFSKVMPYLILP